MNSWTAVDSLLKHRGAALYLLLLSFCSASAIGLLRSMRNIRPLQCSPSSSAFSQLQPSVCSRAAQLCPGSCTGLLASFFFSLQVNNGLMLEHACHCWAPFQH